MRCMAVATLIGISTRNGVKPLLNDSSRGAAGDRIRGGPAWLRSDRYTIDAKADGAAPATMLGPMLGQLLEERFQLKAHREAEQLPMYGLTPGKGGPKVKPLEAGDCIPLDPANPPPARFAAPGEKLLCGFMQDTAMQRR